MPAKDAPYQWQIRVLADPGNGLCITVDSLMDLRNKMGQFQAETQAPDACLFLLDYMIQAAQHAALNGKASP